MWHYVSDFAPFFNPFRWTLAAMHGTIRWFSRAKAYGFIAPDDGGDDVFVRLDEVERQAFAGLGPGDPVTFKVVQGGQGPEARYLALGHLPDDDMA